MRPIHLSDLHHAAISLSSVPLGERKHQFAQALSRADIADRYRKRLRKAHPQFGIGTLTSALSIHLPNDTDRPTDEDYLRAMLVVVTGLLHRAGHNSA